MKFKYTNFLSKFILLTISASLFSACSDNFNKQSSGTLIGGVAGGLLGTQFGKGDGRLVATGIGALAGALIGGQVGKGLDEQDQKMLKRSSHQALEFSPAGKQVAWTNPDSGNSGALTPTRTFKSGSNYCREYTQQVMIGNQMEKAFGTACRQPDGSWKIIK
jgi:surface antigen